MPQATDPSFCFHCYFSLIESRIGNEKEPWTRQHISCFFFSPLLKCPRTKKNVPLGTTSTLFKVIFDNKEEKEDLVFYVQVPLSPPSHFSFFTLKIIKSSPFIRVFGLFLWGSNGDQLCVTCVPSSLSTLVLMLHFHWRCPALASTGGKRKETVGTAIRTFISTRKGVGIKERETILSRWGNQG